MQKVYSNFSFQFYCIQSCLKALVIQSINKNNLNQISNILKKIFSMSKKKQIELVTSHPNTQYIKTKITTFFYYSIKMHFR